MCAAWWWLYAIANGHGISFICWCGWLLFSRLFIYTHHERVLNVINLLNSGEYLRQIFLLLFIIFNNTFLLLFVWLNWPDTYQWLSSVWIAIWFFLGWRFERREPVEAERALWSHRVRNFIIIRHHFAWCTWPKRYTLRLLHTWRKIGLGWGQGGFRRLGVLLLTTFLPFLSCRCLNVPRLLNTLYDLFVSQIVSALSLLMTPIGVVSNHYFLLWTIDGFIWVALLSPLSLLGIEYLTQFTL